MSKQTNIVEKHLVLSQNHAERLRQLAHFHHITEDRVIEKALDILFSLTDLLDTASEQRGWSYLSEDSLQRVWGNDEDAAYDNWRELYGVSAR